MKHVPDQCSECGFVWGAFQGTRYGYGYEQIAARVWRCTRCGYIVKTYDPYNRRVAHS